MDNFKPSHKTPPAATNPTPANRPVNQPVPNKGNVNGGQAGWQKAPAKKTG